MITHKYFVKGKKKIPRHKFYKFFILKETDYSFSYWIQEGKKAKINFIAIKILEHNSLLFST